MIESVAPVVLKRSEHVLAGLWRTGEHPQLVGRLAGGATMATAGAAAMVIESSTPADTTWTILPFDAFNRDGPAPAVTQDTSWRATANGHAVPRSLQTVPSPRLRDWKQAMMRVHMPSESDDR